MLAARFIRLSVVTCAAVVLSACASPPRGPGDPGRNPTGRTDTPRMPMPRGVKTCPEPKPAADGSKATNQYEREWQRIDAEYEQPLREVVNANSSAQYALATLDKDVLKPHNWSLSSYLIRVIRELKSSSVRGASVEIGNETYAEASLRDASWDGVRAWDIVQGVRVETLNLFVWLEKARTTDNPHAQQAQSVADGLLNAARTAEPWVFTGCRPSKPPPERDPVNVAPAHTAGSS